MFNNENLKNYDLEKVVAEFIVYIPQLPDGKMKIKIIENPLVEEKYFGLSGKYVGKTNILFKYKYISDGAIEGGITIEEALKNTILAFNKRVEKFGQRKITYKNIEYLEWPEY
ncbi:hypothetical protein ABVF47_010285 [Snodgrassella alvi]|uniref:hypothetical protein n=1 Tax=Snodgrassella alvi TaxID=1196083 RepID=UPI003463A5D1